MPQLDFQVGKYARHSTTNTIICIHTVTSETINHYPIASYAPWVPFPGDYIWDSGYSALGEVVSSVNGNVTYKNVLEYHKQFDSYTKLELCEPFTDELPAFLKEEA